MYTTTTPNKQRLKPCQRTEVVRVRLTPFEKEELAKRAASSKERTVSNYLRKRAFNLSYAIPPINEEACAEKNPLNKALTMTPLIAQTFSNPTTGGEPQALQIITDSVNLARATALAWDSVWINLFQPLDSGLWIGLVKLGLTLAACSILFLVFTTGKEIIDS